MALTDTTVVLPGLGHIYLAPSSTVKPANLVTPAAPWEHLGHTSVEDGLTITRDGGDVTVLGTWQNRSLRERRDTTTFAITFRAHQADNTVLGLYFGGSNVATADVFGVPEGSPVAVEKALYVRMVDGATALGLYVPKVSIGSDDDVETDVENLLAFPLRATVLQVTGSNLLEFYAPHLGAA